MEQKKAPYKFPEEAKDDIYHLDTKKAMSELLFANRESGFRHAPFEREMAFYESVCTGNLEAVKNVFVPLNGEGFGVLCDNPLQNLKYHLVITIAMITRFCINEGMSPEDSYTLSDIYIRRTDKCSCLEDIQKVHYQVIIDFTKRMREIKIQKKYSQKVVKAIDYISDRLHEKILVSQIADELNCSVQYISRIFSEEVGVSINTYIIQKKLEAAANMLQFSDYTATEISEYYHFSSQSYFIKQFKKYIGITPKEYRHRYYTMPWMKKD